MIDGVVDAEEAVVDLVELFHLNGLVLGVMLLKVERELLFDFLCVDGSRDFLPSLVEHCQHSVVHIVRSTSSRGIPVEQYDAFLGRADKVGNEGVGIEDLPVEEDALDRRQRGADEEVYLLVMFCQLPSVAVVKQSLTTDILSNVRKTLAEDWNIGIQPISTDILERLYDIPISICKDASYALFSDSHSSTFSLTAAMNSCAFG